MDREKLYGGLSTSLLKGLRHLILALKRAVKPNGEEDRPPGILGLTPRRSRARRPFEHTYGTFVFPILEI